MSIYPDNSDKQFTLDDFRKGGYQKIPKDFSGEYHFSKPNGKFIGGWLIKDGVKTHKIKLYKKLDRKKSNSKASNARLRCYQNVTRTWTKSCSADGMCLTSGVTEEYGAVYCINEPDPIMLAPESPDGGSGGGGGTPDDPNEGCEEVDSNILGVTVYECYEEEEEEEEPGDRLCPTSFNNVEGGFEDSFWQGNLNNIRFENGETFNQFSFYFSMANGISDNGMNIIQNGTIVNTNGSGTALEYLLEFFPDIISNGDLYYRIENGQKFWYFSRNLAIRILTFASNSAALGVIQTVPYPHSPLSSAKSNYILYFDQFLKVFAPGSTTLNSAKLGAPVCEANYDPSC